MLLFYAWLVEDTNCQKTAAFFIDVSPSIFYLHEMWHLLQGHLLQGHLLQSQGFSDKMNSGFVSW